MTIIDGPLVPPLLSGSGLLGKLASAGLGLAATAAGLAAARATEELLGIRFDPAPAYLFYVIISGLPVALFTGCEGISVSRKVEEFTEGGMNDQVHVIPGPISTGRVTLRRGLSVSPALFEWFNMGQYDCKVSRLDIDVVQGAPGMNALNAVGVNGPGIVKFWSLNSAFPVSWSLSPLDVNNTTQCAIESLEISCTTITQYDLAGTPMSPTALF
jgi:phage tail-like protein